MNLLIRSSSSWLLANGCIILGFINKSPKISRTLSSLTGSTNRGVSLSQSSEDADLWSSLISESSFYGSEVRTFIPSGPWVGPDFIELPFLGSSILVSFSTPPFSFKSKHLSDWERIEPRPFKSPFLQQSAVGHS